PSISANRSLNALCSAFWALGLVASASRIRLRSGAAADQRVLAGLALFTLMRKCGPTLATRLLKVAFPVLPLATMKRGEKRIRHFLNSHSCGVPTRTFPSAKNLL